MVVVDEKFGYLTVLKTYLKKVKNGRTERFADCKCICGNVKTYRASNLVNNTKSCGCMSNRLKMSTLRSQPNPPHDFMASVKVKANELLPLISDDWAYPGMPDWYYARCMKEMKLKTREYIKILG